MSYDCSATLKDRFENSRRCLVEMFPQEKRPGSSNVTLLKDLGLEVERQSHQVWLWPTSKRDQVPLQLRLIRLRSKTRSKLSRSRQEVYLLTNVFDESRLSQKQADEFYRLRWGVEIFYRSFKQTLDQRKLRIRAPGPAAEELHWSLTALLLLSLMSVQALVQKNIDPLRLSVAGALRTIRHAMTCHRCWRYRGDLRVRLIHALKDDYRRNSSKQARNWPHKKNESPPGAPKIRPAKPNEILCAKRFCDVA